MCGPSQQQQDITNEQQQFYTQLSNEYSTIFGENQAITGALTSAFTPILQAGPGQQGFSAAELQDLNTQAGESVATNYAAAQRATAQQLAAQGGGNTLLPSSVTANILASTTNQAAAQRASALNQIQLQNYAQGYQNWNTAASVLGNTASMLNPTSFAGATTSAGQQAATSAAQMAQESFAPWGAAMGAVGGILGGKVGSSLLAKVPGFGASASS